MIDFRPRMIEEERDRITFERRIGRPFKGQRRRVGHATWCPTPPKPWARTEKELQSQNKRGEDGTET